MLNLYIYRYIMLLLYCVMSGLFLIVYFSLGSHVMQSCAHEILSW